MDTVICPNCGKPVEISQALKSQVERQVKEEQEVKNKEEIERVKKEAQEMAEKKAKEEFDFKLKDSQNELTEAKEKSEKLQENLLEMTKLIRELKDKDKEREIEMEKRIIEETEKMEEKVAKSIMEKSDLEKAELKKKLEDTQKLLEDAQRKASQKSQQLQGEVLELELEQMLQSSFPGDEIMPIKKGVSGADIQQTVKSPRGTTICGTILWESKRTKEWSDKWIDKLKEDSRAVNAIFPVIVSITLPKEANCGFGVKDGVWICSHDLVIPLAILLRKNLQDVGYQKVIAANRGEKADILYSYITSNEFIQQVEVIAEIYKEINEQVVKERMAFEKSWKQRESQAKRMMISAANIYGTIQGKVGASMPPVRGLDLLESGDDHE